MTTHAYHWCPNGCGKCVIAERLSGKMGYKYVCKRCEKEISKEVLILEACY